MLIFSGVLGGIGVLLYYIGTTKSKLKKVIEETQTSSIGTLAPGNFVELKGTVQTGSPLTAPDVGTPCIYYSYAIKRRERSYSSRGSTTYRWRTINSGRNSIPFTLTDETGTIMIDPQGARFDAPVVADRYLEPGESMEDGPLKMIAGIASFMGGHNQKIIVHAIDVGCSLYVLGDTLSGQDGAVKVGKGKNRLFISTKSEENLLTNLAGQTIAFNIFSGICIVGAIVLAVMVVMK